jgi:8-oxo-dGTP pyrophosphatase MutT (NUDIX family)
MQHNIFQIPDIDSFRDAAAAIIVMNDGRYLMQERDDRPGIFYPNHWGLFGGAFELGESSEGALRRELQEELGLSAGSLRLFTNMQFDFECLGGRRCIRVFYELELALDQLSQLTLTEGQSMQPLAIADILLSKRVVPYDSFAVWMHYARSRGH